MSTHACPEPFAAARAATPPIPAIVERLRAVAAAWTAWRRSRAAAARASRAERDLAALSAHVLRDIGACDAAAAPASYGGSSLDLEIRG